MATAHQNHQHPQSVGQASTKVSVVIPVYNSVGTIEKLVEGLGATLMPSCDLEVVLVDDGSADQSAAICRRLAEAHGWVLFLCLSKNFGEHNAVMAGLAYCRGDCAVVMDDDFQNPPGEVMRLVRAIDDGFDVVFARYEQKRHPPLRNLGSWFANAVASVMIGKPRSLYLSSFKAVNRFVIDEIVKYRGPYPYVDGLILRVTRNYTSVTCQHDERAVGKSNYTLRKLVRLWLNMFTNFSILPLRVASVMGLVCAGIGLVLAVVFTVERLRDPDLPLGWASTIVLMLLVSGVQMFALGMIGEYLGRLFLKDSGLPQYVVRSAVNVEVDPPPGSAS